MGERHHLVPRFYLHGWSVSGKGLAAIRRSTGEVLARSAKTVAVETDAYAIETPEGKHYTFEKMLSAVESEAAVALRNMLASWPPAQKDRESWSMLMALQVTRGRGFLDGMNESFSYLLKTMIAMDSRDPASMRSRLEQSGLEPTEENLDLLRSMMDDPDGYPLEMHRAHLLKNALECGVEMLRYLVPRVWSLVELPEPLLVTGDHPLVLHSEPASRGPFGAVGLMTADEVWVPLDPTRLLVMTHPNTEPRVGTIPMEEVPNVNLRIAAGCHEWVVAHPGHPQAEAIADFLHQRPAPRLAIQGPTPAEWAASARRAQGIVERPS